ncbi:P27 family phage terminase small subunit [Mycobacterium intracellulare]|uniref:P27 family phage terminase small subunit n=1 Tax=Mycobacterium intracellulare TaxID=1767 RepID=UPI001446EF6A|nr:P27 family phage terminase small subunit [Mycobacterium intracellulare]
MGGVGSGGQNRRPSHLKAIEGVREDRLNRDEPVPSSSVVVPPVDLPDEARAIWDRLAPDLVAKKVLTSWDVDEFANGCRTQALLNRALLDAESSPLVVAGSNDNLVMNPAIRIVTSLESTLRSIWCRFGLTPGDRAGLKVDDGGQHSGAEAYVV